MIEMSWKKWNKYTTLKEQFQNSILNFMHNIFNLRDTEVVIYTINHLVTVSDISVISADITTWKKK